MNKLKIIWQCFYVSLLLITLGCQNDGDGVAGDVVINLSENLFSAENEETFTVNVTLENLNAMSRLEIRKLADGNSSLFKTMSKSEVGSGNFTFTYSLTAEDLKFDEIIFRFNAMWQDGTVGGTNSFKINNKFGIYVSNVKQIARVTGASHPNDNGLPSPNNTCRDYDVCGTDLGIIWAMDGNKVGIFFGDTFGSTFIPYKEGGGGSGGNWRSNVLAFSEDTGLDDGLTISGMAMSNDGSYAREIALKIPGAYNTSIPTSAIRANGSDYVHYMNIYNWSGPNYSWITNHSSLYVSRDGAKTWSRVEAVTFAPGSNFSQVAYAKKDGYVYMIGTLAGRGGAAYLARILERNMENMQEYEYWNGNSNQWVKGDERSATIIIPAIIGEASLIYHEKFQRWIYTYTKEGKGLVYRDTKDITNWKLSKEKDLAVGIPGGIYGSFIHPLSANLDKLYFIMSIWYPYNSFLISVDMKNY